MTHFYEKRDIPMLHNYHTHTPRCNHALGQDREYVEAAVAAGLKTLGFSDHSPYIFPEEAGGYYSSFRMRPEQLSDYVGSVESLKKEFKDRIRIVTGVEIEYYPKCFDRTEAFLKAGGVSYMLLGQHMFGNEFDKGSFHVAGKNPGTIEQYKDYVSLIVNSIKSGKFLYVAHPDIYYFDGPEEVFKEQSARICEASKETNVPLEINLLGYKGRRHYPGRKFLEVAAETGCPMIFGIDAHRPEDILEAKDTEARFREEYKDLGLKIIDEELI